MSLAKLQDTDNIKKSGIFLYTRNDKSKNKIKRRIPFIISSKRINYLGINWTNEVQDLHIENYKTLLKEIKEDVNK